MSGVQIHSQDPISPVKAGSQTWSDSNKTITQATTATAVSSQHYPSAQPGVAVPKPTGTTGYHGNYNPPPPQPGAFPTPQAPMTTAKASLPPPPKNGETPRVPNYHNGTQPAASVQPQPYPPQMSQPSLGAGNNRSIPSASISSITAKPSTASVLFPTTLPGSHESSSRTSLEHPPGYVQNPYASDMTAEQRLAMERPENATKAETLPSLGYYDDTRKRSNGSIGSEQNMFEAAMKWGKDKGKQLGELHEQLWDSVGRK